MSVTLMWELGQLGEANHNRPRFTEGLWMRFMEYEIKGTYQVVRPLMSIDTYITSSSPQGIRRTWSLFQ